MNPARFAALLALAAVIAAPALAEDLALPALYKSLAEKNHYPAAEGLKDAQADVKCNILDQLVAAFPDAVGKPISVKYVWSRPGTDAAPTKKFMVSGIPETLTDLSNRAGATFKEAEDFVVADPVYWIIATTDAKAGNEAGKITVTGGAKSSSDPIKKLMVDIDGASYQVRKVDMDLGQAHVVIEQSGKDLGGKWGIETTTVSYPQYKKVLKFEYAQVDGFWLPAKITIDYNDPDGKSLRPTFSYEFSNWQVNKGLPPGTF